MSLCILRHNWIKTLVFILHVHKHQTNLLIFLFPHRKKTLPLCCRHAVLSSLTAVKCSMKDKVLIWLLHIANLTWLKWSWSDSYKKNKKKTSAHSSSCWNIKVSSAFSRDRGLSNFSSWLTADNITPQTIAASRVIGSNNLGVQMLRHRAGNVISGGAAQFCATLCFPSCFQSSALRCYLRRPDGGKILFFFLFLGIWVVSVVFLSLSS